MRECPWCHHMNLNVYAYCQSCGRGFDGPGEPKMLLVAVADSGRSAGKALSLKAWAPESSSGLGEPVGPSRAVNR